MKIISIILLLIITGCVSHQNKKFDTSQIKIDMASVNKVMRGRLFRNDLKNDLSKLTVDFYLKNAKENQAPSETEYFDFLESHKPTVTIRASKKDFVVCIVETGIKLIICDIASTAMTDFESDDLSLNMNKKINEFLIE